MEIGFVSQYNALQIPKEICDARLCALSYGSYASIDITLDYTTYKILVQEHI